MEALNKLQITVTKAYKVNSNIKFEVFIHKVLTFLLKIFKNICIYLRPMIALYLIFEINTQHT